jgi:hypothetical protein
VANEAYPLVQKETRQEHPLRSGQKRKHKSSMDTQELARKINILVELVAIKTAEQNGMNWDDMSETEAESIIMPSRDAYRKDANELVLLILEYLQK